MVARSLSRLTSRWRAASSRRGRPALSLSADLSGSGKSSVARALAPHLGNFPGAVQVRSDRERKRLFGVGEDQKLPPRAYTAEMSDIVYAICRKRVLMALMGGQAAILDAVHAKQEERDAIADLARRAGVAFTGIWLEATARDDAATARGTRGDVSDATATVLDQQLTYDLGEQSFAVVDAGRPLDEVVASCLEIIGADATASRLLRG